MVSPSNPTGRDLERLHREWMERSEQAFQRMFGVDQQKDLVTFSEREGRAVDIGRELARIATAAFGMTVLALKRDPSRRADEGYCLPGTGDPEGRLPAEWLGPAQLDSLLARADVVVLCAPLIAETRGLIGEAALRRMKPSAYFINVGRGETLDEAAHRLRKLRKN